ncbi:MAG: hypothetical protein ACK5Y2_11775 [Bdellovibrionales bacterium]
MNSIKTWAAVALLAITSLQLSACTDRELAFGAGVIIGAIIADDDDHHHHHRPNPPRYRGRRRHSIELRPVSVTERVAMKYNLDQSQAETLVSDLQRIQAGDLQPLAQLGFQREDVLALYQGQNPSASTLQALATHLDLELVQAHELIQNIKADVILARERMQ